MKILLDENFPLGLVGVLQADGLLVEHIITLNWRGASDATSRNDVPARSFLIGERSADFFIPYTGPL